MILAASYSLVRLMAWPDGYMLSFVHSEIIIKPWDLRAYSQMTMANVPQFLRSCQALSSTSAQGASLCRATDDPKTKNGARIDSRSWDDSSRNLPTCVARPVATYPHPVSNGLTHLRVAPEYPKAHGLE